jgi:hypothetical protein
MVAMASDWLKNWKSLKIFFRTMGWIETNFSQNAGTAHYYIPSQLCWREDKN